jgi:hypothetical protein
MALSQQQDPVSYYLSMFSGHAPVLELDRDKAVTLDPLQMLAVEVLDIVSFPLRYEAEENEIGGLFPPSLLNMCILRNEEIPMNLRIPDHKRAVNLHHLSTATYNKEHYIVSLRTKDNKVILYDSIPQGPNTTKQVKDVVIPQLRLLYNNVEYHNIQVTCPQDQGRHSHNCGLFAIAWAMMLIKNLDPCSYEVKVGEMRPKLKKMLNSELFQLEDFTWERRLDPSCFDRTERNETKRLKIARQTGQTKEQREQKRQRSKEIYASQPEELKGQKRQKSKERYASQTEEQKEQQSQRNKTSFASQTEELKEQKKQWSKERYASQTEEQKEQQSQRSRERYASQPEEQKEQKKQKRKEKYMQVSQKNKKNKKGKRAKKDMQVRQKNKKSRKFKGIKKVLQVRQKN